MMDEQPTISFCGVRVFASRGGASVRGRVELPDGKTVPIDYRSTRPGSDQVAATEDPRASQRLALLNKWESLCGINPDTPRTTLARRVADEAGISVRSLQLWKRRLDLHGVDGLRDSYVGAPPSVLTMESDRAGDAVLVAAWWSFRVGNLASIDNRAMVSASSLLSSDVTAADVLVAIDCYYSWPCDRRRYPFKPFDRWARHDFRLWLLRACDREDYRRAVSVLDHPSARATLDAGCHAHAGVGMSSDAPVPLLAPTRVIESDEPSASERSRAAGNVAARRAIRRLVTDAPDASPPATASNVASARRAKALMREGFTEAARECVGRVNGGLPALASVTAPGTMAEALASLRDDVRRMLFAASKGDRTAFDQAAATLPLWYDRLPEETRFKVERLPGLARVFRSTKTGARRAVEIVLADVRAFKGGGVLSAALRISV